MEMGKGGKGCTPLHEEEETIRVEDDNSVEEVVVVVVVNEPVRRGAKENVNRKILLPDERRVDSSINCSH
jgi:hypothetical protein